MKRHSKSAGFGLWPHPLGPLLHEAALQKRGLRLVGSSLGIEDSHLDLVVVLAVPEDVTFADALDLEAGLL